MQVSGELIRHVSGPFMTRGKVGVGLAELGRSGFASRGSFGLALERSSEVIASDLAGAMEDRRVIVGIMIHPDVGFDIMMAKWAR